MVALFHHVFPGHIRYWLWGLALVVLLGFFYKARKSMWLVSLLVLPGTLAHELCHLILGWILHGRPKNFTLIPKRKQHTYELGSVTFSNTRWYNAFFIGMAPFLLLGVAYFILRWRLHQGLGWSWMNVLWLYVLANLLVCTFPSKEDLRIAARSPIGWILLVLALGWGWMTFHRSNMNHVFQGIIPRDKHHSPASEKP